MLEALRAWLGDAWIATKSLESRVAKTKKSVIARQNELDFGVLGRSLSHNPYQPRAWGVEFGGKNLFAKRIYSPKCLESLVESRGKFVESWAESVESNADSGAESSAKCVESHTESTESRAQSLESHARFTESHANSTPNPMDSVIDLGRDSTNSTALPAPDSHEFSHNLVLIDTTLRDNFWLISFARRYCPHLIIHNDIVISKYQILESALYGADMIVLDSAILDDDELAYLRDFAAQLGMVSVAQFRDNAPQSDLFDFALAAYAPQAPAPRKNPYKYMIYYKN